MIQNIMKTAVEGMRRSINIVSEVMKGIVDGVLVRVLVFKVV